MQRHRPTTDKNYLSVWRNFNQFIIALDRIPESWEERISTYCTFLVKVCELKSATVKSYVSAIKSMLLAIDYTCDHDKILLNTLTDVSRNENDAAPNCLPIRKNLLEQILFEIERKFSDENPQPYLELLFQTVFMFLYYGLLRISEITDTGAGHALKAKDVHFADSKEKILLVLHSSKTHSLNNRPQKIKISATASTARLFSGTKHFCPFDVTCRYLTIRGNYYFTDEEQFFILPDRSPLLPGMVRRQLKETIMQLGLNHRFYDTHSFRSGRASDLRKIGCPVDTHQRSWQMVI